MKLNNVDLCNFMGGEILKVKCAADWKFKQNVEHHFLINHLGAITFVSAVIGHNPYLMRQTACLVINPTSVDSYVSLFNCTTADRTSDSMTAST